MCASVIYVYVYMHCTVCLYIPPPILYTERVQKHRHLKTMSARGMQILVSGSILFWMQLKLPPVLGQGRGQRKLDCFVTSENKGLKSDG